MFQLVNNKGHSFLEQTEGVYDAGVPAGIKPGPQRLPDWNGEETESLLVKREHYNELGSHFTFAQNDTNTGLRRFPRNPAFDRSAGRLARH